MDDKEYLIKNQDKKIVATGELYTGKKTGVFKTSPLGSCVAVIAYDKQTKAGGIAHIMLAGKSPKNENEKENKYADNALSNLLTELKFLGTKASSLEFCLVGGANVLRKENEIVAQKLVDYLIDTCRKKKLNVKKSSLGGFERRTATLDLYKGIVYYTVGDGLGKVLWQFSDKEYLEEVL